ncbi:type II toxin-antitoxin system VapC family toxin [Cyanobacteria bacterium FACHB-63]|nr:type II toxin-antitoxin system VapC family toxin [Cyanobacteria bacterium FACHB-63]
MKYLLDTDHISLLQRRSSPEFAALLSRMSRFPPVDFALSIISFHEQAIGAHDFVNRAKTKSDLIRGYTLLSEILQGFSQAIVLPFDAPALAVFEQLQNQKIRVSTMDLRIASIALSRNLAVLTRNTRDFQKVPALSIEDWTV